MSSALERALTDFIEDSLKENLDDAIGDSRELDRMITNAVDSAIGDADNLVTQDELRGVEGEIETLQGRVEDLESVSTEEVAKEIDVERERINVLEKHIDALKEDDRIDRLEHRMAELEDDNRALRAAALAILAVMNRLSRTPASPDS